MARAKKTTATRQVKSRLPVDDFEKLNTWSPAMAARWAGIPLRSLYRLLRDGSVPAIPMGETQSQKWPNARNGRRERKCFRYVIPRVAFQRWFENIGAPDPSSTRNPAA